LKFDNRLEFNARIPTPITTIHSNVATRPQICVGAKPH